METKSDIYYRKGRKIDIVKIDWLDANQDFEIFCDFLIRVSKKRMVFAEMSGLEGIHPESLLKYSYLPPMKEYDERHRMKIQVIPGFIDTRIFENEYVDFDIFTSECNMTWSEYSRIDMTSFIKCSKELKKGRWYMKIDTGSGEEVNIYCRSADVEVHTLLSILSERGYNIHYKRSFFLFEMLMG